MNPAINLKKALELSLLSTALWAMTIMTSAWAGDECVKPVGAEVKYDKVSCLSEERFARVKLNDKWGFIDKSGNWGERSRMT